jgi:hypothetical protein
LLEYTRKSSYDIAKLLDYNDILKLFDDQIEHNKLTNFNENSIEEKGNLIKIENHLKKIINSFKNIKIKLKLWKKIIN